MLQMVCGKRRKQHAEKRGRKTCEKSKHQMFKQRKLSKNTTSKRVAGKLNNCCQKFESIQLELKIEKKKVLM